MLQYTKYSSAQTRQAVLAFEIIIIITSSHRSFLNYAYLYGVPAAKGTVELVRGEQQLMCQAV